ncbi:MAG: hypothetical protein HY040_24815 [Planctomycetes bacterium]|nr:hypothetical protein [Planctomycetota bacterium]
MAATILVTGATGFVGGAVVHALQAGAGHLAGLTLAADAPPVFLLDWRRRDLQRSLGPGMLDNRWEVFPEDMPSAQVLQSRGISRVVLVERGQIQPQRDLTRVLRAWQEAGIALEFKDTANSEKPCPLIIAPVPWYSRMWFGVQKWFGQAHSPPEGFGYIVPERRHG